MELLESAKLRLGFGRATGRLRQKLGSIGLCLGRALRVGFDNFRVWFPCSEGGLACPKGSAEFKGSVEPPRWSAETPTGVGEAAH